MLRFISLLLWPSHKTHDEPYEAGSVDFLFDMWEYEHAKTCRQCALQHTNEYDGSMCSFAYATYLRLIANRAT